MPVIRLLVAAPLVALLGVAMAVAVWPDGEVTSRDRELVARLTRGGVQRLDTDGGHWTADAVDLADTRPTLQGPATPRAALAATLVRAVPAPAVSSPFEAPAVVLRAGRPVAPALRDRAPPRR